MDFSVDIINLVKYLKSNHESVIANQIGRSGTSIGANIHEAQYAQGKKDFISKLEIALFQIFIWTFPFLSVSWCYPTERKLFIWNTNRGTIIKYKSHSCFHYAILRIILLRTILNGSAKNC
ncbi:MAG: four helix bundle protein [Ruminococcaceae bacterium]|nr:four helix bundle protein [Oscillospiraceae bacterium]